MLALLGHSCSLKGRWLRGQFLFKTGPPNPYLEHSSTNQPFPLHPPLTGRLSMEVSFAYYRQVQPTLNPQESIGTSEGKLPQPNTRVQNT